MTCNCPEIGATKQHTVIMSENAFNDYQRLKGARKKLAEILKNIDGKTETAVTFSSKLTDGFQYRWFGEIYTYSTGARFATKGRPCIIDCIDDIEKVLKLME